MPEDVDCIGNVSYYCPKEPDIHNLELLQSVGERYFHTALWQR